MTCDCCHAGAPCACCSVHGKSCAQIHAEARRSLAALRRLTFPLPDQPSYDVAYPDLAMGNCPVCATTLAVELPLPGTVRACGWRVDS